MPPVVLILSMILLCAAAPFRAQWIGYVKREYRFSINFPLEPSERNVSYTTGEG